MGQEPNNLAAIDSLTGYRALRFGKHVELILTDQHSYRSEDPSATPGADDLGARRTSRAWPEEFTEILDAGRAYNGGKPPAGDRSATGRAQLPQGRAAGDHAGRQAEGLVLRDR